jgi:flagellar hook-length control protein FliK
MMAGNQLKMAEIRLTPAELGPLRVRVSVEDGAANVTFHAQHAVTREAIEQALPRLREMLAENGLSLGQADVGEHGVAQGDRDRRADDQVQNQVAGEANDVDMADERDAGSRVKTSNGLVDTFA